MIYDPTTFCACPGYVLHTRTSSMYGRCIRRALGSWGNHDGIICYDETTQAWYIAEALLRGGFQLTPWANYERQISRGKTSVLFLKPPTMPVNVAIQIDTDALALARAGLYKYDRRAIWSIFWNLTLRLSLKSQREWQWYCTEAVSNIYRRYHDDVWGLDLPTPLTTEKRIEAKKLFITGRIIAEGQKDYNAS